MNLSDVIPVAAAALSAAAGLATAGALRGIAARRAAPGRAGRAALRALAREQARRLGARGAALVPARWRERCRRRIGHAALVDVGLDEFLGWELEAVAGGGALVAVSIIAGSGIAAFVGLAFVALPELWLADRIGSHQLQLTRELPWCLDLLTLAVEAGLDFGAGLAKVVERGRDGALRGELTLTLNQLKLGSTREEALRALAARTGNAAVTAFATALVHASRMGTPLGAVLRAQAAQLRDARSQRAEKLANEAPVKMLFPLVAFIFPTVFMVLFGPLVFQLVFGSAS